MAKKLRITVDGINYEVLVDQLAAPSAPLPRLPAAPADATATPVAQSLGKGESLIIASRVNGTVVSVDVEPGDVVTAGKRLCTIEAMKTNTYVTATLGGKVDTVFITAGKTVTLGEALVRLA